MRSLICMFDSGYTLPQGREVINYFYPLQYGYDGLIKMCEEGIAETIAWIREHMQAYKTDIYNV